MPTKTLSELKPGEVIQYDPGDPFAGTLSPEEAAAQNAADEQAAAEHFHGDTDADSN